jgi:hypothetical protein
MFRPAARTIDAVRAKGWNGRRCLAGAAPGRKVCDTLPRSAAPFCRESFIKSVQQLLLRCKKYPFAIPQNSRPRPAWSGRGLLSVTEGKFPSLREKKTRRKASGPPARVLEVRSIGPLRQPSTELSRKAQVCLATGRDSVHWVWREFVERKWNTSRYGTGRKKRRYRLPMPGQSGRRCLSSEWLFLARSNIELQTLI